MSTIDSIATLLRGLDGPVAPRAEFTETLLTRLLQELRVPAPSRMLIAKPPRVGWPRAAPRRRWSVALAVALLLLLLAGIATATYLGVRDWISSGPGGSQVTSGYRLDIAFAPAQPAPPRYWEYKAFALGPGGHDLYTARVYPDRGELEVLRIRGIDTPSPAKPVPVLDARRLADPALWAPATVRFAPSSPNPWPLSLSVAGNGDAFLLVQAADRVGRDVVRVDDSLVVLHPNSEVQKVLTLRELQRSGAVRGWVEPYSLRAVATAPGRVWLSADVFDHPVVDSWPAGYYTGTYSVDFGTSELFEVVDPNGDGNWSDRVVRRLGFPASVPVRAPARHQRNPWQLRQIAAEPGSPDSVLMTFLSSEGRFRVYRIVDRNHDGDALDPGEAQLVLDRQANTEARPVIAPRVALRQRHATRELVIGGLTRTGRVAIVSETGAITEIARSLPDDIDGILAGSGRIYPILRVVSGRVRWPVYRLEPVARDAQPQAVTPVAPRTTQTPICRSADGRKVAYYSNAESPNENFLYLANADGSGVRKITERAVGVACPFTERWLLLTAGLPDGSASRLIRHDVRSGREVEIAHDVPRLTMSPDGRRAIYIAGLNFSTGTPPTGKGTLRLVDLTALRQRQLAGPLDKGSYNPAGYLYGPWPAEWSPDGRRIAYVTGPSAYSADPSESMPAAPPRRYGLWVRTVASAPVLHLRLVGGPPRILWSPDGKRLLVCVEDSGLERGCATSLESLGPFLPMNPGRLLLVDVARRSVHVVRRGSFVFAAWSPSGRSFAYATPRTLFVQNLSGPPRRIAVSPHVVWPAGVWHWSSNSRFLQDPSGRRWPTGRGTK